MSLNFQGFLDSLPIMLYGMAGIFTVIGIIYIFIAILRKLTAPLK